MATWIGIAVIAWIALSVVVSLVVGGMIRVADSRRVSSSLDLGRGREPHRPSPTPTSLRRVS
jgi:hypothetical protein